MLADDVELVEKCGVERGIGLLLVRVNPSVFATFHGAAAVNYLGGDFSTDGTLLDWAFDSGWKLGIGVWFKKKFALDFTYQGGFVFTEAEWKSGRYSYEYADLGHTS